MFGLWSNLGNAVFAVRIKTLNMLFCAQFSCSVLCFKKKKGGGASFLGKGMAVASSFYDSGFQK